MSKKITIFDMIKEENGAFAYPQNEYGEETNAFDLSDDTIEQCIFKIDQLAHYIRLDWSDPRGALQEIHDVCKKLRSLTTGNFSEGK